MTCMAYIGWVSMSFFTTDEFFILRTFRPTPQRPAAAIHQGKCACTFCRRLPGDVGAGPKVRICCNSGSEQSLPGKGHFVLFPPVDSRLVSSHRTFTRRALPLLFSMHFSSSTLPDKQSGTMYILAPLTLQRRTPTCGNYAHFRILFIHKSVGQLVSPMCLASVWFSFFFTTICCPFDRNKENGCESFTSCHLDIMFYASLKKTLTFLFPPFLFLRINCWSDVLIRCVFHYSLCFHYSKRLHEWFLFLVMFH